MPLPARMELHDAKIDNFGGHINRVRTRLSESMKSLQDQDGILARESPPTDGYDGEDEWASG